jgi:anthranilate 1,2-dioxygenase small subunit
MTTLERDAVQAIHDLLADAARHLDEGAYEAWAELFTADCVYKITSRENADRGLPIGVVYCDSQAMLRDRILSLRKANIYNPHYVRHVVGHARVLGVENGRYRVHSSYLVTQTTLAGESRIFSVGKYLDLVVLTPKGARFKERIVVADTGAIHNLLAVPL